MTWISGPLVYAVIWWLLIFVVLPFGNQPIDKEDIDKGQASSAPKQPRIALKFAINTVLSAIVWLILYWIQASGAVSFR